MSHKIKLRSLLEKDIFLNFEYPFNMLNALIDKIETYAAQNKRLGFSMLALCMSRCFIFSLKSTQKYLIFFFFFFSSLSLSLSCWVGEGMPQLGSIGTFIMSLLRFLIFWTYYFWIQVVIIRTVQVLLWRPIEVVHYIDH